MSLTEALAPTMIGRQAQLQQLDEQLQAARQGAGRLVLISGEAGVGKTRLLHEFLRHAGQHVTVFQGACYPDSTSIAYSPFLDALDAVLRHHGSEQLARAAGPLVGDLASIVPELVPFAPVAASSHDSVQHKRRLCEAVRRVIQPHPPQQVAILVLEDVHWSDRTSQEMLPYLAQSILRDHLLVIATYRSDELHRRHPLTHTIAELTRQRLLHDIHLPPLNYVDTARMLEATLARQLPSQFAVTMFEHSGGTPFVIEELLKSLLERGRLDELLRAAEQGNSIHHLEMPLSVKDSILSRTNDLDATSSEALSYAAVIGRRFSFDLLLRLTNLDEATLMRSMYQFVELQLIVEEQSAGDDVYSFRHALTREVIYDDLLGRDRRLKHRAVLHALEALHADALEPVVDQLAYHSWQARELAQAAQYARIAGDKALRTWAYREAVAHYEVALDMLPKDDERAHAELLDKLGHAAYALGDHRRIVRYWQQAQQHYERIGDRSAVARVFMWLGRLAKERGSFADALPHFQQAITLLEAEPPGRDLALAYGELAAFYMTTDQHRESIRRGKQALRLARNLDDLLLQGHALNTIGSSLTLLGRTRRGIAYLECSLQLAEQCGAVFDINRALYNIGRTLLHQGELKRAAEVLQQGAQHDAATGRHLLTSTWFSWLGWVAVLLGHWDRADALFEQARIVGSDDDPPGEVWITPLRGELLRRRGKLHEARALLEGVRPDYEQRYRHHLDTLLLHLAEVYLALGEADRAVPLMERCLAMLERTDRSVGRESQLAAGIEAYLHTGDTERARTLLEKLEQAARRTRTPNAEAYYADAAGLIAAHEQQHDQAVDNFGRAVQHWQAMRLPFEEGRSRRRRAESLLGMGKPPARDAAIQELVAAHATFERLGAAHELEQANVLLYQFSRDARRPRKASDPVGGLTRREQQVIALLAKGYSNRQIAEALVISEKTAEVHVGNILSKLGFSSRAQAAAYAVQQGLAQVHS